MKKQSLFFATALLLLCANAYAGPDRNQRWDAAFSLSMIDTRSSNIGESLYLSGGIS